MSKTKIQIPPQGQPIVGQFLMSMPWYLFFQGLLHFLGFRRGALVLPSLTSTERDTLYVSDDACYLIHNSTTDKVQAYYNSTWNDLA